MQDEHTRFRSYFGKLIFSTVAWKPYDIIIFQIIAKAIRDMYGVEKILFKRSISLPPRYPETHFLLYRVCTGPKYELCSRYELWNRMGLVQDRPPNRNHWKSLTERLCGHIYNQQHMIGYAPRLRLYKAPEKPYGWVGPEVPSTYFMGEPCECIPPCECEWKVKYYNEPWVLKCLIDAGIKVKPEEEILIMVEESSPILSINPTNGAGKQEAEAVGDVVSIVQLQRKKFDCKECDCEDPPTFVVTDGSAVPKIIPLTVSKEASQAGSNRVSTTVPDSQTEPATATQLDPQANKPTDTVMEPVPIQHTEIVQQIDQTSDRQRDQQTVPEIVPQTVEQTDQPIDQTTVPQTIRSSDPLTVTELPTVPEIFPETVLETVQPADSPTDPPADLPTVSSTVEIE